MNPDLKILETTLRDGSYAIDYRFSARDTKYIARCLDDIGFEYIEVGPGIGFNAVNHCNTPPSATDREYIEAARSVVTRNKLSYFFIPGIGRKDDLYMASDLGLDMVRIGTNITEYSSQFEYIELCKNLGMETSSNLMKSYAVPAREFGKITSECSRAGSDYIYLVDSAGGMLPEEVKEYLISARETCPGIRLGFHGHNNLGLAMANTLVAIESGVELVDSSLRGMGRSSGNTQTEKLLYILKRLGRETEYDMDLVYTLSEEKILPLIINKHEAAIDHIYGYAKFHSSFTPQIFEISSKHNIDPLDLIIEYSKIDILGIDPEKLEHVAKQLINKKNQGTKKRSN